MSFPARQFSSRLFIILSISLYQTITYKNRRLTFICKKITSLVSFFLLETKLISTDFYIKCVCVRARLRACLRACVCLFVFILTRMNLRRILVRISLARCIILCDHASCQHSDHGLNGSNVIIAIPITTYCSNLKRLNMYCSHTGLITIHCS